MIKLRFLPILVSIVALSLTSIAQDDAAAENAEPEGPWKTEGLFNLNISQTNLVNWTAGGENTAGGNLLIKYAANYKKGVWKWNSDITIGYGGLIQGDEPWRKTDDRIEINTLVGREAAKNWYYSAFAQFRTQMFDGFKLPNDSDIISTWMAPAYISFGLGMDYSPNEIFTANISPVAGKITIVNNPRLADAGAFGVADAVYDKVTGEKVKDGDMYRFEIGGNISLQFKKEIVKNVTVDTKLNLFSNYVENPQNIDVNWDFLLNMKVNEWLAASFSANLIYDHDIDVPLDTNDDGVDDAVGPRTQFKQVFGAGLNLTF